MVTPEQVLDAALALAEGRAADVRLGDAPEEVVKAAMTALTACVRELSIEIGDRLGVDPLTAAHAALVDGVRFETELGLKVHRASPRVVRRREVERDSEGRLVALVDVAV